MKTRSYTLARHPVARSGNKQNDQRRKLTKKGNEQASLLGQILAERDPNNFNTVVTSSATRCQSLTKLAMVSFPGAPEAAVLPDLYPSGTLLTQMFKDLGYRPLNDYFAKYATNGYETILEWGRNAAQKIAEENDQAGQDHSKAFVASHGSFCIPSIALGIIASYGTPEVADAAVETIMSTNLTEASALSLVLIFDEKNELTGVTCDLIQNPLTPTPVDEAAPESEASTDAAPEPVTAS